MCEVLEILLEWTHVGKGMGRAGWGGDGLPAAVAEDTRWGWRRFLPSSARPAGPGMQPASFGDDSQKT